METEKRLIDAVALKRHMIKAMVLANTPTITEDDLVYAIDREDTVASVETTTSCEDPKTEYITFPDGLRLIFREGEYVGWYVCGGAEDGNQA